MKTPPDRQNLVNCDPSPLAHFSLSTPSGADPPRRVSMPQAGIGIGLDTNHGLRITEVDTPAPFRPFLDFDVWLENPEAVRLAMITRVVVSLD